MSGPVKVLIVRGVGVRQTKKVYKIGREGGRGPAGPGLTVGGLIGQISAKISDAVDFATAWFWPHKVEVFKDALAVGLDETLEISLNGGGWQLVAVTGNNATISIIDWPAAPYVGYLTLELSGAGAFTGLVITNGKTSEGAALDLSIGIDFIQCSSRDAGATVILSQVGKDYS